MAFPGSLCGWVQTERLGAALLRHFCARGAAQRVICDQPAVVGALRSVHSTNALGAGAFGGRQEKRRRCGQQGTRCLSTSSSPVATECSSPEANKASQKTTELVLKPQIKDIKGADDEGAAKIGETLEVSGWVRTLRTQKSFAFMEVNDGSTLSGLQVVLSPDSTKGYGLIDEAKIHTGAAVAVVGELVASIGGKQKVEVQAKSLKLLGQCDPMTYPLQKKRHTLEFLRGIAHLRPRTNTIGAVMRIRSALAAATHNFFQSCGFHLIHTPLISSSDCEGAGEMFQVTTMLNTIMKVHDEGATKTEMSDDKVSKRVGPALPLDGRGSLDYSKDFFSNAAFLTVSGQLNAEMYACALGRVYTFGPTFRAENSNTSRHLAEFWMVEPEMAFADLHEDISLAEAYVKHCLQHVLENCQEDLGLFERFYQEGLVSKLQELVDAQFVRMPYTDAVDVLAKSEKEFEFPVKWGDDLQTEHERYLTEVVFKGTPVFVTDYPKEVKSFYMKVNDDGRTVAATDMLVPGVGELIGASQREDRLEVLEKRMTECGLNKDEYWWYLDLRRYGSVPHAGFGLGFERLVQFVTGMENIRDVIPFPRYPDHCDF